MKKSFLLLMSGIIVGMMIQQYIIKDEMGMWWYVYLVVMAFIISSERVWEVVYTLFIYSFIVMYVSTWVHGMFKWYEPLILLWVIIGFVFHTPKIKGTLFVEEGDITRFSPTFVPDVMDDEFETYK